MSKNGEYGSPNRRTLLSDVEANDSDKKFTVPDGTIWRVESIKVQLISTATGGDRQLLIEIQDAADLVIAEYIAQITQAASLTRDYMFGAGLEPMTSVIGTRVFCQLPSTGLIFPPGFGIRVYDEAAVDAAADDMTVQILGDEISIV